MKKKLNIAEAIMAIVFIAASASAGVSYTPLVPKTFECLVFEMDIHQLRAVEAVDEKGSKYVHVDIVPRHLTEVFYYRHTSGGEIPSVLAREGEQQWNKPARLWRITPSRDGHERERRRYGRVHSLYHGHSEN